MKRVLLKFFDWIYKGLSDVYREEKLFMTESDKKDWKEIEKEYFKQSKKLRNDVINKE